MSSSEAKPKPKGRPVQPKEMLDITGVGSEWDSCEEVRDRMRKDGLLMSEKVVEDIPSCLDEKCVLWPFLARMSLLRTRPMPDVASLRVEIQEFFLTCKRPATKDDEAEIIRLSWRIRKLLGFIKMKTRRHEVSTAPCLDWFGTKLVSFLGRTVASNFHSALEVPDFQDMCLELDPSLQARTLG